MMIIMMMMMIIDEGHRCYGSCKEDDDKDAEDVTGIFIVINIIVKMMI